MSRKVPVISEFLVTLDYDNHVQLQTDIIFHTWDGNLIMEIRRNGDDETKSQKFHLTTEEGAAIREALGRAMEQNIREVARLKT